MRLAIAAVALCSASNPQSLFAQAPSAAGFTPGSFRVTGTGAATYKIPIQVPPGIAGMAPDLSLVYSSQGGNGILGVGWSIAGLSAIHRCPKTVAQDGVKGSINYDANDRFCLDGQRLVAITGTYGGDGTVYRTERESYTKVVSFFSGTGPDPDSFKAWTKSGLEITYGTGTSRTKAVKAPSAVATWSSDAVSNWAVSTIKDSFGNTMSFQYNQDLVNGGNRPDRIDYTSNGAQTATYSVRFAYDDMPSPVALYQTGAIVKNMKRLTSIRTYINQPESIVKDYRLGYNQLAVNSSRSRLVSILECGDDTGQNCLPKTEIAYASETDDGKFGSMVTNTISLYTIMSGNNFRMIDLNGDGKADMLYRKTSNTWVARLANSNGTFGDPIETTFEPHFDNSETNFKFGDFNGDGIADVMYYNVSPHPADSWSVALGNGAGGFAAPIEVTFAAHDRDNFYLADFNGDGRTDVLYYTESGDQWSVRFGNGDGTFAVPLSLSIAVRNNNQGATHEHFRVGDFNGDGRADVMYYNVADDKTWSVRLSNGDGTFGPPASTMFDIFHQTGGDFLKFFRFGDFNGDGKLDVMYLNPQNNESWTVRLGNGDGSFADGVSSSLGPYQSAGNLDYFRLGDFNGDGKTDVMTSQSGLWSVRFGKGDGTFGAQVTTPFTLSGGTSQDTFRLADVNGDGKTDVLALGFDVCDNSDPPVCAPDGLNTYPMITAEVPADAAVTITSGLGAATTLSYKPLSNNSSYTKDSGAAYPVLDFQGPQYVTTRVSTENGIGGLNVTDYTYAGARLHLQGGGFLGFSTVAATNAQTGVKTTMTLRRDYPFQGLLTQTSTQQPSGSSISSVVNSWTDTLMANPTGKYHKSELTQTVESGYELSGNLVTTRTSSMTYDAFGNATVITSGTGDGYSKTTTNTYTNDTDKWFLGRMTRSTVQSTIP